MELRVTGASSVVVIIILSVKSETVVVSLGFSFVDDCGSRYDWRHMSHPLWVRDLARVAAT